MGRLPLAFYGDDFTGSADLFAHGDVPGDRQPPPASPVSLRRGPWRSARADVVVPHAARDRYDPAGPRRDRWCSPRWHRPLDTASSNPTTTTSRGVPTR